MHVCASDGEGGAARATYRIHRALAECTDGEVTSAMRVCNKVTEDAAVQGGPCARSRLRRSLRYRLQRYRTHGFSTASDAFHSVAWPATGLGDELARSLADLVHLHWLGRDTLSVEEVGKLRQPVVWTMHDMWSFCGAEHYTDDSRYVSGYTRATRPAHETGPDLNRWTWKRKARAWRTPMHLVAPSTWLRDCVRRSHLMHDWPCAVIPNPLDLSVFRLMDKREARMRLGLPADVPVVLFGAIGVSADRRKGADLLLEALAKLRALDATGSTPARQLLVFGERTPTDAEHAFEQVAAMLGAPLRSVGVLRDDAQLQLHYAAADVMVVPSRMDNLPQTATEAMACGTPVVAFRLGGLPDIVQHERTGYLAEPLDSTSLAEGIRWALADETRRRALSAAARTYAEKRWAPVVVARQYATVYREVLAQATPARGAVPQRGLAPEEDG
ncbi:MAG: glycosyltransferase [Gemmatimonadaceae bacterium]